MAFDIGVALGGLGLNLVNNAVQYYTQKNQQRQAQSNEQKNMRLQSELEQQGYYNNIVRTPQALRDAGLNPAAATGMNIAAPSVTHSGNSQSVGLQTNAADIVNSAALNQSQVKLNEAAAEKAHAEAVEATERTPNYKKTGEEIESRTKLNREQVEQVRSMVQKLDAETLFTSRDNLRRLDEDKLSAELVKDEFKARFEGAQSQYERDFWLSLLESANGSDMTVGALMALRSWTAYNDQVSEWQKESLARQVQSELLKLQLDDNDVIYSLAHMPVQDFLRVQAEIADLTESSKFRKAMRQYNLPAQELFLKQQTATMKNNDFVGHMNKGEFGQAAISQIPGILRLAEDAGMMLLLKKFVKH